MKTKHRTYAARDNLVITHLRLVRKVARGVRRSSLGKGSRLEDLEADGRRGLVEAATRFDPTMGTRFSVFAKPRIWGAMVDGIRAQSPVGRRAYERLRALASEAESPPNTNGSAPFISNSGTRDGHLQVTERAESGARWNGRHMAEHPVAEDDRLEVVLAEQLGRLPNPEQQLLVLRFFKDRTLTAAAREMGVGVSWASRLHARALRMLHRTISERAFDRVRERALGWRCRVRAAPETKMVVSTDEEDGHGRHRAATSPCRQESDSREGLEDRNTIEADNALEDRHEPTIAE